MCIQPSQGRRSRQLRVGAAQPVAPTVTQVQALGKGAEGGTGTGSMFPSTVQHAPDTGSEAGGAMLGIHITVPEIAQGQGEILERLRALKHTGDLVAREVRAKLRKAALRQSVLKK